MSHPQQFHGQAPVPTASPKSPGVAVILSVLLPGAGHLYSGNPVAAVVWFVSAAIAYATLGILVGFLLVPAVYISACIHAYLTTASFNARHHVVR